MRKVAIAILVLLMAAPLALAQGRNRGNGPGGGFGGTAWLNNTDFLQKNGITDEQKAHLKEIVAAKRDRLIDLKAEMQKLRLKIRDLMVKDPLLEKEIRALDKKMLEAKTEMHRIKMELRLEVMKELTAKQREAVMALKRMGGGKGGGKGLGGGKGGGKGPGCPFGNK